MGFVETSFSSLRFWKLQLLTHCWALQIFLFSSLRMSEQEQNWKLAFCSFFGNIGIFIERMTWDNKVLLTWVFFCPYTVSMLLKRCKVWFGGWETKEGVMFWAGKGQEQEQNLLLWVWGECWIHCPGSCCTCTAWVEMETEWEQSWVLDRTSSRFPEVFIWNTSAMVIWN